MKKVMILLLVLILLLLVSGCTDSGYKSIEEAMQSGGIQNNQIYHKLEVKDDLILFYENPYGGVDAGIVYKVGNRYKWGFAGGTSSPSTDTNVAWSWSNLDSYTKGLDRQYQLYIGIVKEPSIIRLHIENIGSSKYFDKDAEIVELSDGTKLWYALQDKYSIVQPGFTLNGFDKDGKNMFHYEAEQSIH